MSGTPGRVVAAVVTGSFVLVGAAGGAAGSSAAVNLDTVKLANGRWAVDSGGRCS